MEAVAEVRHPLEADRSDHLVRIEFLGADVRGSNRKRWIAALEHVADRLHQVRLAQPHTAVQEERVVGLGRLLGDRHGRCMRELVRSSDNKFIEGIARIELMVRGIEIQLRLWRRRCRRRRNRLRFGRE